MKKISFQAVDHPQVEFDCIGESVKSPIIASAKVNPNFPEPWAYFDLVSWKLLSLPLCEILLHCVKSVRIRSYAGPHFSLIFPHSDWIQRDTPFLSVFSLNVVKYGPEKLRIQTLLTQNISQNMKIIVRMFEFYVWELEIKMLFRKKRRRKLYMRQSIQEWTK